MYNDIRTLRYEFQAFWDSANKYDNPMHLARFQAFVIINADYISRALEVAEETINGKHKHTTGT